MFLSVLLNYTFIVQENLAEVSFFGGCSYPSQKN